LHISTLTYAVGDIHGRYDLLESLLAFIDSDAERRRQEHRVIFLGDIVDRGPDSKNCIELVASTLNRWPKSKLILGNHDDWFLQALGGDGPDPAVVRAWFNNGGLPTILNYDYEADLHYARQAITREYEHHIALFRQASMIELDGTFAFVHAGINPGRAIDDQTRKDCLWIREPFFEHDAPLSHVVVHGHTITESRRPAIALNRISVDTGAVATGNLTALIIDPLKPSIEFAWTNTKTSKLTVEYVDPDVTAVPDTLKGFVALNGTHVNALSRDSA
jgi:serine/threonine protein phosphatase 1